MYGTRTVAFGMGHQVFDSAWLCATWREYYCLWPGLSHLCYRMAVRHGRDYYCLWLGFTYLCSRMDVEYYCLWHGLSHLCHRMAVRCMARVLLLLAWAISCLLSYGSTLYGASMIAMRMSPHADEFPG